MGQVMHIDQIVKRIEALIMQLEAARYTKDVLVAAKLNGHIEEAIAIGGINMTESWSKRIALATVNVALDEPKPTAAGMDSLGALRQVPVTLSTNPASSNGPPAAPGVVPANIPVLPSL